MSRHMHVSQCGHYMATYLAHVCTLKVQDITTKRLMISYDVSEALSVFLRLRNLQFTVTKVAWEPVLEGSRSTKIALIIDEYGILMVFDITQFLDPIIIQQETTDGIQDFFWIPPVAEQLNASEGSYVNGKQILIYTKNYLQVRLYSLDCTRMLWKLLKPISKLPILHPINKNMWSLVLESDSNSPTICHFYNHEGSVSHLLYKFRLPVTVRSDQFQLSWNKTGNWLVYFNEIDTLYGFQLQVFNSFGLFAQKYSTKNPVGVPIININWLDTGIENIGSSFIDFGFTHYFVTSISTRKAVDYIVAISTNDANELEFVTVCVQRMKIISRTRVHKFNGARQWIQRFDTSTLEYTEHKMEIFPSKFVIKDVLSVNSKHILIQFDDSILILEIVEDSTTRFTPIHHINTEKIKKIDVTDPYKIIVHTINHVFLFDFDKITVLYHNFKSINTDIIQGEKVLVYENDDWEVVEHQPAAPRAHVPIRPSLPILIKPISPIKRGRFRDLLGTQIGAQMGTPVASTSFSEEQTDTFQNKRFRRI